MSVKDRLSALYRRHYELDEDIKVAYSNFGEDDAVRELKKQKLRIKDKIRELEALDNDSQ